MKTDPLVLWAWSPGADRTIPPMSHAVRADARNVGRRWHALPRLILGGMESIDLQVLQACVQWLQQGLPAVRHRRADLGLQSAAAGSTMAIRGDGVVVGSVSGGCIEDDLIAHARAPAAWSAAAATAGSTASPPMRPPPLRPAVRRYG
jgi:hypothetical protein